MIVHEIHDLSNHRVCDLLRQGLADDADDPDIQNYHPDHSHTPGNLFYILDQGRYAKGRGKYYVLEHDNQLVASAGWNQYDLDSSVALLLSRAYTKKQHRNQFFLGQYLLPRCMAEAQHYPHNWITVNEHNLSLYSWCERYQRTKKLSGWPAIYGNFKPAGKKDIYYTTQWVVELTKKD
jgi:hypothetical protein